MSNLSLNNEVAVSGVSFTINEQAFCPVKYTIQDGEPHVTVTQADFEQILSKLRSARTLLNLTCAALFLVSASLAGTAYWFTTHPLTRLVAMAPACAR